MSSIAIERDGSLLISIDAEMFRHLAAGHVVTCKGVNGPIIEMRVAKVSFAQMRKAIDDAEAMR